ncbi:hypothetical protein BP6252_01171 [Coleophoma cylindrospora]|uniref:Rhodopsin domain-containing protein n=1 Tax=Coleophoma cylindrospora TaxID=1849047 RepID=A0A3D8SS44_9HELO|nr:hypothetical protein BP6252_01171 [Coleophoma cylindrospora]
MVTFLTECSPISLAWQVVPTISECAKAPQTVIVMGGTNILTDLLLMLIPLPVVFRTQLPWRTKVQLCGVFSIGVFVILVSVLRIKFVLADNSQQNKLLWAELECFAAAIVANGPILYGLYRYRHIAIERTRTTTSGNQSGHFSSHAQTSTSTRDAKDKESNVGIKMSRLSRNSTSWFRLADEGPPDKNVDPYLVNARVAAERTLSLRQDNMSLHDIRQTITNDEYDEPAFQGIQRTVEVRQEARSLRSVDILSIAENGAVKYDIYSQGMPSGTSGRPG